MKYMAIVPFDEVENKLGKVIESAWTEVTDQWLDEMKEWKDLGGFVCIYADVYSKTIARVMITKLMARKSELVSETMISLREDAEDLGGIPDKILLDILLSIKALCADQIRQAYDKAFESFTQPFAS